MRIIHNNSYALIYPIGKRSWKMEIYRIKIMGLRYFPVFVDVQKVYAFKQSAIRFAEKHLY